MPFKPIASKDDYPEHKNPRCPWMEWGPQEQERNLRKALNDGLYGWLNENILLQMPSPCRRDRTRQSDTEGDRVYVR